MTYTSLESSDQAQYPYSLRIAHLYGNLMNTYGDNGNILMLKYVAEKLGAHVTPRFSATYLSMRIFPLSP